jgi:drug/metabolite transporter (DMT)-like permease
MDGLSRRQVVLLVLITVVGGLNWPVMKLGITGFPALTFRALCIWISLPVLALVLVIRRVPFAIRREHWRELGMLTLANMICWHTLAILALRSLSSGRAAILGYTMPVFSALVGAAWFSQRLRPRVWAGVAAAAVGVVLLLWYQLATLSGKPLGVAMMLVAAAMWAVGTQWMRHTRIDHPTLAIIFWMTLLTAVWMTMLSVLLERGLWSWPTSAVWGTLLYNALLVIAFAQVVWLILARDLPPIASTLSVMLVPVLGVFSGAWWLGEALHWQDCAAVGLVMVAIATVLWPGRGR